MEKEINEINKDELILKEYRKLKRIMKPVGKEQIKAIDDLLQRLAFMTITLSDLENDVKENGAIVLFENGKQLMRVENPAQKSYNTMINRYNALYSTILGYLAKAIEPEKAKQVSDGFDEFVGGGR
ncbi:hypothetical protein [Liquorilactobacillus hordei]|uniref:hypothetical protein n=1 Tax=Liquorilactobacillus hordei TaxID=468911 RepID=UPI0039E91015